MKKFVLESITVKKLKLNSDMREILLFFSWGKEGFPEVLSVAVVLVGQFT